MTALCSLTTINSPRAASWTVAATGLGYVGLRIKTIAYVRYLSKIGTFFRSEHPTKEELQSSVEPNSTNDPEKLKPEDFIIVALPTPVTRAHSPDFGPAVSISETVGPNTKHGALVYESTVCGDATSGARNRCPNCARTTACIP